MYEQHLKRAEADFGSIKYKEEWTPEERCIVLLRTNKLPYTAIQQRMGNPSKKRIREILLKCAPELIDLDCNYNKLKAGPVKSYEKRLINLLTSKDCWEVETDEDFLSFSIKDGKLFMIGELAGESFFLDWDESTQQQLYNQVVTVL